MAQSKTSSDATCQVTGSEHLKGTIEPSSICAEVERVIRIEAPTAHYSASIEVLSPSRLAATLVVDGQTLPVQNFAVMDRNLSKSALTHFAQSLAALVKAQHAGH